MHGVLRRLAYSPLKVTRRCIAAVSGSGVCPISLQCERHHFKLIRSYVQPDLVRLTELTIETFRPFYEDSFRPLVGDTIFANQHGNWRDDYREQVAELHNPTQHKYVAVAEAGGALAGYVAWSIDPERRNGSIVILAVAADHRRSNVGTALCEHAFDAMRQNGAEVVEIGTGGDEFHAPARALYESLGCVQLPVAVYYRKL